MGDSVENFDWGEMSEFNSGTSKQTRFFTDYNPAFVISQLETVLTLKEKEGISNVKPYKSWKI
jgi:hypothetical protein